MNKSTNSPMLRLTIPMIVGMCGANLFPHVVTAVVLLIVASVAVVAMVVLRKRGVWFSLFTMVAALCIGAALFVRKYNSIAGGAPNSALVVGTLAEQPQQKARSIALRVRQTNGIYVELYVKALDEDLHVGDTIIARVSHLQPTDASDNQGDKLAFYRHYLFSQGVCATAFVGKGDLSVRSRVGKRGIVERLRALQGDLHDIYASNGIDGDEGSVIEAMTIGRRESIDKQTRQNYSQSGVSHVLALSGFHVGVIMFVLQWLLLSKVMPIRSRWISSCVIICALWCYVLIAGSAASLVRAATMCTILLLCRSFTHQVFSLNSVVLTLTAMLCYNPLYLLDVGFQLSFAAVFGIALLFPRFARLLPLRNRLLRYVWGIVATAFICNLATAPLVAYHFGQVPVYGIFTNLLVCVLVTVLLILAVAWWIAIGISSSVAGIVGTAMMTLSHTINAATEWVAALPCATLPWQPSTYGVVLCYAIIALAWCLIHNVKVLFCGQHS